MNDHLTAAEANGPESANFRRFAESLPIAIAELDLDLRILYANKQALTALGVGPDELSKGLYVKDVVTSSQVGIVTEGLRLLAEGAKSTPMSLRLRRKDGVEIPTETNARLITQEGVPTGFLIFSTDMTRRLAIEEKLRQQEGLYQIILDHSHFLGILIVNDKYAIEYVNDHLLMILGRTRREMLGADFRKFIHPDSVELVADYYVRRQRGEDVPKVYVFKVQAADGSVRDLRISSSTMMSSDGSIKTVAQLLDITEDLEQERALAESDQQHRVLIETMDSGLCLDDENGICRLANQALANMLGYESPEDLIDKPITMWVSGWTHKDVEEKVMARKEGKHEHYELSLLSKSGELVPAIVHASPWVDSQDKLLGSLAVFTDVSELKRAEAEARFLLDLLLHDIGNQLQLILAGADLLDGESTPAEIENARRYVIDGANRCIELITNVRRAEESKSEPLVPTDLAYVLRTQIRLFSSQYGIIPEVEGLPDEVIVEANAALGHMFWNLMENSIKHNPESKKRLWITGKKGRHNFILKFADNGPGLDNRQKSRLFDPTRRSSGVGIHLVRRLASKYEAHLSVNDRVTGEPEKGLEVSITFNLMDMSIT